MKLPAPSVIVAGSVDVGPDARTIQFAPCANEVTAVSPSRCSRSVPEASVVAAETKSCGIHDPYCSPQTWLSRIAMKPTFAAPAKEDNEAWTPFADGHSSRR